MWHVGAIIGHIHANSTAYLPSVHLSQHVTVELAEILSERYSQVNSQSLNNI